MNSNNVNKCKEKTTSRYHSLRKRIISGFQKKKFIGDIIINDSEYEILIEYLRSVYVNLKNSNIHNINDPILATALVQIGIKHYDGNFWTHVAEVIGVEKISHLYQGWIGDSFVTTLSLNNKIMLDRSEKVNNILMHGFVSDHYADDMFNFLFKYYSIDLERDLQRNNSEMMDNLIEVTQRSDNTGRSYLLVKQTANAIGQNIRGGKIRIRRILKLIDRCFWEQITLANPVSRLSVLFNNWQENSSEFKLQCNRYNSGSANFLGKKSYSSPYIKCDFENTKFKLVLPTQLIKFEFDKNIKWEIYSKEQQKTVKTSLYEAITGYKTELKEIDIGSQDIFDEYIVELTCNGKCIRHFKIKSDCVRFFDTDGDYLNSDNNLPLSEVYAFTKETDMLQSQALVENEPIGKLIRWYFQFEYGDIIRLPDGKPISIGKKAEEGLLSRNVLKGAYAAKDKETMPIYSSSPYILLKILEKRANGTVIEINNRKHRLFDKETTVIDLNDRSGEKGYILNLSDYGCSDDGIYTVYIDVPNDRTNRLWTFGVIKGISYEFEEAPYIFTSKGTIRFNEDLIVYPQITEMSKNSDENSFNFEINSYSDNLNFTYNTEKEAINLIFHIPVFMWKFENGKWNVEKPIDIWHSKFPSVIYFKYPEDKMKLNLDEHIEDDYDLDEHAVSFIKSKSKGIFECDVTRFKSWFGREKLSRNIYIDFKNKRIEFIKIITRSEVASHILRGDFEAEKLIGELEIIGNANYYVDVMLAETKEVLAEKLPLNDGKFNIETKLNSGTYEIKVYEDEEDDTGFGVFNYLLISKFKHDILNPYDLKGKSISIKHIRKGENSVFQKKLSCQYIVNNLQRVSEHDKNRYKGRLLIKNFNGYQDIGCHVNVEFFDLNKLRFVYLTYYDGYDFVEFIYDTSRNIIVKDEEKGLKRSVRYRRYECLFPEDYIYVVDFINNAQGGFSIR